MTIGGLESTMANRDCSLPTTSSWTRLCLAPVHLDLLALLNSSMMIVSM
jgi:hypothetical protein